MGDYTITGSTETNTITVKKDVSANITLSGVTIDVSETSGACAFKIEDNSKGDVTITLADDSVNTLSSGYRCAGLQKNGSVNGIGKLTIQGGTNGTGKLISKGNVNFGAGIGGGDKGSTSNIKITGGTVTASGSFGGAGIGGGNEGSASDIEITGGKVFATGGSKGAGIGGGYDRGNGSKITISGGIVTANGDYGGAGIGGGNNYGDGTDITITGGVVTANGDYGGAGIGGGNIYGNGTDITITGGVVTANGSRASDGENSKGIGAGGGITHGSTSNIVITGGSVNSSIRATPTLADGTTKVYLYQIDGASSIEIDGEEYPTTHIDETSIYPYLSVGLHIVKINGTEKVIYIADDGTITDPVSESTQGAFKVFGGTENVDYTYSSPVLTISGTTPLMIKNASTGSTTDRIEVADGISANITLAGVDIALSGTMGMDDAALKIYDESTGNVTITLAGGSVNTLKSGAYCAGLQKSSGAGSGTLTITGTGTLIAIGGNFGAGIGGGYYENGFNITIKNGVISATGGSGYAAGIGGGRPGAGKGEAGNIIISGGSVQAEGYNRIGGGSGKAAVTPTLEDGTPVYLLDKITNTEGTAITINGTAYLTNHNGEQKIYPYLPAKTAQDPNIVTVGTTTTKYCYDEVNSKWLKVVDIPDADPTTFTYDGTEKTYTIAESEDYTVANNVQTDVGDYTVTVTLNDSLVWSDGTTVQEYTFKISKAAAAPAVPTASAAVEYGKALADAGLTEGWAWEDGNSKVPQPANNYTAYKELTDDNNYDYSGLSGFSYDRLNHRLCCEVPVTVNAVTPVITITASPDSAITGKATTVTVTATAKNPYNDTLTDVPTPAISYKIGTSGTETTIRNGSFVIPDTTSNGTEITILAKTDANAKYSQGTGTTTITVKDCTHSSTRYVSNVDEHWKKCEVCGAEFGNEAHTSGEPATLDHAQLCTVCDYEIAPKLQQVAAPTFNPNGGTFSGSQSVTITSATEDAKIYYTTDGSAPTTSSTLYAGAFTINATTTVKAIAVKDGMVDSEVVSATFTKKSSGGSGGSSGGGGSYRPTTPTPDPEPIIKGENGKTGWDAVADEIKKTKNGGTVKIDMNGLQLLPGKILDEIAGKNINLVLDMGNGFEWTINGLTVTNTAGVDMGVSLGSSIPVAVINAVTKERSYITITLEHTGDFGFKAKLSVNMGSKNKGYFANLYYFNEGKNTTEFISSGLIGADGRASLDFTHASEYIIVIDNTDHGNAGGTGEETSKPDTSTGDNSDTSSDTSSENSSDNSSDASSENNSGADSGNTNPSTGVVICYGIVFTSTAAIIVTRKKRNKK